MTEGIWVALIGLAGVAFGSLGLWFGRRKLKAEAAQIVTDTALKLIEPLNERIETLEGEVAYYRGVLDQWRTGWNTIATQLSKHNLTPDWTPPAVDIPTKPRRGNGRSNDF